MIVPKHVYSTQWVTVLLFANKYKCGRYLFRRTRLMLAWKYLVIWYVFLRCYKECSCCSKGCLQWNVNICKSATDICSVLYCVDFQRVDNRTQYIAHPCGSFHATKWCTLLMWFMMMRWTPTLSESLHRNMWNCHIVILDEDVQFWNFYFGSQVTFCQ